MNKKAREMGDIEKVMFENELYSNITILLKSLKERGFILVNANSKPIIFTEEIVNYFNILQYFELIVGSNLDGTRTFNIY